MTLLVDTLLQGLLLGGTYAIAALGLALAFGVMRLTNIAHGDMMVLSAYLSLAFTQLLGLEAVWTWLLVVPAMAFTAYLTQRVILNRAIGDKNNLSPLIITFGLSLVLQSALQAGFSADTRRLHAQEMTSASVQLTPELSIGFFPVLTLALAVVAASVLHLLFQKTSAGRAFRAASDDPEIVQLMGIDVRHVFAVAFAVAGAAIGISGIVFGLGTTFDPSSGPLQLLTAFEAVIIGGLGSFYGTLVGALSLGMAQAIGYRVDPGYGAIFGHLAFLAVLVFRPEGLFPKTHIQ